MTDKKPQNPQKPPSAKETQLMMRLKVGTIRLDTNVDQVLL